MAEVKRRFHDAREIIETYVPDYKAPEQSPYEEREIGECSGRSIADDLLHEFGNRLSRRKPTHKAGGRTPHQSRTTI